MQPHATRAHRPPRDPRSVERSDPVPGASTDPAPENRSRTLARHSLVRIDRGFEALDHELVEVEALLEKVLPADRINEMAQRIRNYAAARASLNGQEGSALLQGE